MKQVLNGKEMLFPDEMNLDDGEMELIESILEKHWQKVSQIIYKIEHIRGELGEKSEE